MDPAEVKAVTQLSAPQSALSEPAMQLVGVSSRASGEVASTEALARAASRLASEGCAAPNAKEWRAWQRAASALLERGTDTPTYELAMAACQLGLADMYKVAEAWTVAKGKHFEGADCIAAAAAAGQTRMLEFIYDRLSGAELDDILNEGDLVNALAAAADQGHAETVTWLAEKQIHYTSDEKLELEAPLSAAYARGDFKMAELLGSLATQEACVAALPSAYLAGSVEIDSTALWRCREAKLSEAQVGACLHAAAQAGSERGVWALLEKHAVDPEYASLGAAQGGRKALCLRMIQLCGDKVPVGTLHAAIMANVPAERVTELQELIAALRALGADPEVTQLSTSLFVQPETGKPAGPATYSPYAASLAIELALAEAKCAASKTDPSSHAGKMAAAQAWNAVLRAAASAPAATLALDYAGARGGNAWDDVLALATEAGAQTNAEYAEQRGATTLGALLRASSLGLDKALERLGKGLTNMENGPSLWLLAGQIAADHKQSSAFAHCAEEAAGAEKRVAAALAARGPAAAPPEAKSTGTARGQATTESKAAPVSVGQTDAMWADALPGVREAELAALFEATKVDFSAASSALARFRAEHLLVDHAVVLDKVLCRACAAGHMDAFFHALRLGARVTLEALFSAGEAAQPAICDILLRYNVRVPRARVALLPAPVQAKLCPTHIVD